MTTPEKCRDLVCDHKFAVSALLSCSAYKKQEGILYILLDYAEMDLSVVIKEKQADGDLFEAMPYLWKQMLRVVKVRIVA